MCASPSAHRADTEYSSTKRDGHVPPVPVTARTDRVRVTPSPHPGMGCLSFHETVTIVFSHTTPRVCRCSHLERCLPPARTNSSMERKTECAQCKRCNGNERALRLEAGIGKHSSSALLSQGSAPLTCPLKSSTTQSMNFWRPDTTFCLVCRPTLTPRSVLPRERYSLQSLAHPLSFPDYAPVAYPCCPLSTLPTVHSVAFEPFVRAT